MGGGEKWMGATEVGILVNRPEMGYLGSCVQIAYPYRKKLGRVLRSGLS